jgi:hypothetical protein
MNSSSQRDAVMHVAGAEARGWPSISLVGLAEAHTARGLRQMHVSMPKISAFAKYLREESGDEYALASQNSSATA